ncbi:MAG: rnjA [Ignavibacteria bacterium]|nr:rnjA [Ignavibacteria bacterium]
MLNLTIHRGTDEIGGSCVELWNDNTRIVLDFGMPLVDKARNEFDFKQYSKMSVDELIEKSVLPAIPGLYKDDSNKIDGLLISHAHADHYGLLNYIGAHVPVWLGEATYDIIQLSGIFTPNKIELKNHSFFQRDVPFNIGDFKITPFWNDHSAFDSYVFLIECDGIRILYSGDFRSHGRKSKTMQRFIAHPPPDIDYLIMEGTQVGRNKANEKNEEDIEKELVKLFREPRINLVYTSSQNIDRLVSIYKASLKTKKIMIIDVYIAKILTTLSKYAKFPYPSGSYGNIKVMFTKYTSDKAAKASNNQMLYDFKPFKITKEEIGNEPSQYVIIVRPSFQVDLEKIQNLENGNLIYSMWEGYKSKADTHKFMKYLEQKGFSNYDIHTSGHADLQTLKKFADAINPKSIIPIHTFNKNDYSNIFNQNIIELNDGEVFGLS